MLSSEIRKKYLEFFEKRGHKVVASDLLVPKDDPTVLFTGAGMNQFKEQFMGKNVTFKRATSCQKCLRTGDLERVGKTPRHHTFFEMLGNFSFGDYFKREAIEWAWEFMTGEMKFPKDKLWISVYKDDQEAYDIWFNEINVPKERIVRLGPDCNFWPADAPAKGPNGPCGPCSEIFYDWGPLFGCGKPGCDPSCDCSRFIEVWNLVFTEFERKPDGSLIPLPNKNIDTGMGLERITSVVQGVPTNFKTDIFVPITEAILRELGDDAKNVPAEDICLIADHLRSAAFTICDGVSPSNEKRGYVVRKLIRRASLKSKKRKPFLYNLVPVVVSIMKGVYPEMEEKREHISAIVEEEEKRFNETLDAAMPIFEEMVAKNGNKLKGEDIFRLVDTYGLPLDIIADEAEPRKISLDIKGFEENMEKRKDESRKGSNINTDFIFQPDKFRDAPKPELSGAMPLETEVVFILRDGAAVDGIKGGDRAEMILSPQSDKFYSEGGGQTGDAGEITNKSGRIKVVNTCDVDGRKVLQVVVEAGEFKRGDKVVLVLDQQRKSRTARNHTATHLLQAALRMVLGDHVKQSGSYVDDKRLRFDFTHMKKLADREVQKIENIVNQWVKESIDVCKKVKTLKEAKDEGALSFFGEKYGDMVRMVSVGNVSKELCGGTHIDNTEEIGVVKVVSESSVASGVRRIEALTGDTAREWLKETINVTLNWYDAQDVVTRKEIEKNVEKWNDILGLSREIVSGSLPIDGSVVERYDIEISPSIAKAQEISLRVKKEADKKRESEVYDKLKVEMEEALQKAVSVNGSKIVSWIFEDADVGLLRRLTGYAEQKAASGVVLIGMKKGQDASLLCAVTRDLAQKGVNAKEMLGKIVAHINGGGGGNNTFAQAGGKNSAGLEKAIESGVGMIKQAIESGR